MSNVPWYLRPAQPGPARFRPAQGGRHASRPRRRVVAVIAPAGAVLAAVGALAAVPLVASTADAASAAPARATAPVVPSTTKAVTAANIASVAAHGSAETITFSAGVSLRAGDIIVAGIGKATPDGLIAKVTKVSGDTVTATKATLRQALPQGSFAAKATFSSVESGTIAKNLACGAGGRVITAQGSADVTVVPTIAASWTAKSSAVTLTAAASGTSEVAGQVPPGYSCSTGRDSVGAITHLAPFQVSIGGVPVVVTPKLSWYVQESVQTSKLVTVDVTQKKFDLTVKMNDTNGRYSTAGTASASTANNAPPTIGPSANQVTVTLGPVITMGLFGQQGPTLTLGLGSRLSTTSVSTPWWSDDAVDAATGAVTTPTLALSSAAKTLTDHVTVAAHAAAAKTGFSVYGTLGSQQGAVRGPDGRIWVIAFDPPEWQGAPTGSQALDVVNPVTLAVNYYGPLPPYIGSKTAPTLLSYTNGAPAFDSAGQAFMIATATAPSGAQSYYLVRYTPGPSTSAIFKVPASCPVPEGITSAGDGSVWMRCGVAGSTATPKVLRVTSTGAMKEFGLAKAASIGNFAAGASGTMWAVGYNAGGASIGLVRYTPAGKESYYGTPKGYSARSVAGNGSGRVIEIATCGSGICYLTVSTSGGYRKAGAEPGKAAAVSWDSAPTMDVHGDVWTLNDGSVYKTGQYFLEFTAGNKTRAFAFTTPGGCGPLAIAGSPAASADGSAWVESASNCTFMGDTSNAYSGALVRYLP